jgi:hypothetical protein
MKKVARGMLIFGALLAVLLGVGLVVALNSSVQTSVARHYLQQSDPQAKIDSVALGLGGGEVRGLEMSVGGQALKLGSATIQYSLMNLVFGHTKVIDNLIAKDLVLDTTQPAKPAAKTDSAIPGATGSPLSVLVRQADFAGTVLLPSQRSVQFTLTAQNVGAASAGQANGTVIFQDKSAEAPVSEMRTDLQCNIALDAEMKPQNLDILANLAANLPGQAEPARLQVHAQGKAVDSNASDLSLTLGPGPGAANWVTMQGTCNMAQAVTGEFTANLTRAEIEPFAMGCKLPDFDLHGQGRFAVDGQKNTGSLTLAVAGSAANFDVLRPELAGLGQVQWSANIDADMQPGKSGNKSLEISAKTLVITLAPSGGQTALALELLKPTTVEYGDKGLVLPAGAGADLARLTLTQAPAAWLAALLPKSFSATGQGWNGQITLSARDDGAIIANTTKMLTFDGLNVKDGDDTLLSGGALELDATLQYLAQNLTAQVRRFNFQAHSVAAGGVNLSSVSPDGLVTQERFVGNVAYLSAPTAPQMAINGSITAALDVDNLDHQVLGKDLPFIAPAGIVLCNSAFDVVATLPADKVKNPMLEVNAFQATLSKGPLGPASTTLATVAALQKFSIPLNKDTALAPVSGNLATIEANAFPLALVQPFLPANVKISGNPLKGKILLAGAAGSEAALILQTLEPMTIENAGFAQNSEAQFSNVTLSLNSIGTWQSSKMAGQVRLQAASPQGVLMDLTINATAGPGTMSANVTANGRLGAIAEQPIGADWRYFLPDPKPEYTVSANITSTPSDFTLSSAEVRVVPSGGVDAPLADAKLIQAFTLHTVPATAPDAKPTKSWPQLSGDVASIKLSNLPAGVLALAMPGYLLHGQGLTGDVVVRGTGDGNYSLVANAPVVASGLTVARQNAPHPPTEWVHDLTFSMMPSATFSSQGVSAWAVENLTLASDDTPLAHGSLEWASAAGQNWPLHAKVSLQADLAQLLTQPILQKYDNLAYGLLSIDGAMDTGGNLSLNANLTSWAVHDPDVKLPKMVFENATGKVDRATGAVQLTIPIKGEGITGSTDCQVVFGLEPSGASHKFTLNVTGNNLIIDDLLAVQAGLFPPPPTPERPPGAPPPDAAFTISSTPDKSPLWGDWQGSAQIQLKKMTYHNFAIDNFAASAQVSPTQAVVPGVTGNFQGAPIALNATLGFNGTQADTPYQLQSSLSFKNFNAGAYFQARDPSATPPVEGNFDITGAVNGQGANLDDLIDKVQFNFSLGSSSGTFHLLDLVANKVGLSGKTLKSLTSAAGALVGLLGNKVAGNAVAQATSVTDLISTLDSFQYTKLVFEAQRGADHNVKLSQFDVQGPTVEMTGTGQISYVRGQPIPDQPLAATLNLNAKGTLATAMQTIHLLGGQTANGYAQGPQFKVTGTIQKPNYNFLYDLLTEGLGGLGILK